MFEIFDVSLVAVILVLEHRDSSLERFDIFLLHFVHHLKGLNSRFLTLERLLLIFDCFRLAIDLNLVIGDLLLQSFIILLKFGDFRFEALQLQGVDPDLLDQFVQVNFFFVFFGIVAWLILRFGSRFGCVARDCL